MDRFPSLPGSSSDDDSPYTSVAARPFGVTLITIYDGVMVGAIPAVLTYLSYFGQPAAARPSVLVVFAVFLLSAGVITAAASAWRGENSGRIALLVLTTIYYVGLMAGADYTVDLASFLRGTGASWETALRVGRSLFWIALHGWYFLFSPAAGFFASPYHR
jgi:hypothetical protein